MRKELISDRWNFILYEENGIKIIDVDFFNSFVDISKKFKLQGGEVEYDFDQLKALAEDIRNNYETYKDREILEC
jgi:hypothetical protein